jgi:hypothetical protein
LRGEFGAVTLDELRTELLTPGTGDQRQLKAKLQAAMRSPAAREELERSLVARASERARWELVRLAGMSQAPQFIPLIAREALRRPAPITRSGGHKDHHHAEGDDENADTRNAILAARELIDATVRGDANALAALLSVLATAPAAVAMATATELFSRAYSTKMKRPYLSVAG